MNRSLYKVSFTILFSLLTSFVVSQTLYWVGGSGSFNDPKHWSLKTGGTPAFVVPDINTDVIFDDNSGNGYYQVNFDNSNSVKNLKAISYSNLVSFTGQSHSVVYLSQGIYLSQLVKFESNAEMIFNNNSGKPAIIEFGLNTLNCNLYFNKGEYIFRSLHLNEKNSIQFADGNYNFNKAVLVAGNISGTSPSANFQLYNSYFKSTGLFKLNENSTISSDKFYLVANINSAEKFVAPANLKSQLTNTLVNYMAPLCNLTITAIPSCFGPCTGVLTVSFSAGCTDNPYSIFVNNPDPTCAASTSTLGGTVNTATTSVYTASNACACPLQNYQILVFDASSNFVSQNVNFIPNPAFLTNVNTLPLCPNSCTGKMTGNIFGNPPFSVTVTPSASVTPSTFTTALTYTLTNMCAGVYTFNIVDANGCSTTLTRTLTGPPAIVPNAVTNTITCFNVCNGGFTVSPTGGTPGYTVVFSTSASSVIAAAGSAGINSLCVGAISATITDANGCTQVASTNITQPTSITATPSQTNLTCFSNCTGAASVAVSGGTTPYSFTWSPGPGNSAGITGLCAGVQTVNITDNNGCAATRVFTITSPPPITITVNSKNLTCNTPCTGSASALATGGTGAFTYTWTGPAPFVPATTTAITNLCAGVYTINVSDAGGCIATRTVNILQPPPLTLTINKTDNTCFSSCAGSATAVVSGGNGAPFTYVWTSGTITGQGTATVSNLCATNYTLSVTDASACPVSSVITITQPTSVTPNITSGSVTCNAACNGSINANPSGGSGPYTFTLVTPFATTNTAAPPYTNLCAGIYTLTIRDALQCPVTRTINIQQPNPLVPSVSTNSITCFNACNGSLAGSVSGGTPSYTLSWNTATSSIIGGVLTNQCAGTYTFIAIDANNCVTSTVVTLAQPTDITTTLNITNPTCNGGNNGSIGVITAGGTPGYTLNWSSGSGNPNTGLGAGNYTLFVTDANGCNKSFTATLTAPPAITLAINTTSTSCAASCDGSATVTATGGTAPFTYQFSPPVVTNTTGIRSPLCPGAYLVSVSDANGCPASGAFNISAPPLLTAAITGSVPTCNVCTGAATVTVGGGTPTYTINWTNSVSATVATGSNAANLCLGTYTANVVDSRGCTAIASVNIVNTVSVTVITGGSGILCFGACTASATANAIGGTSPYTYTWNSTPTQNSQTATNLCAGPYTVTVTDALGCFNTGSINITQPASITVNSTQTNIPCFGGTSGAITNTVTGGTGAITYSWSPGGQTTSSLTNLSAGQYTLTVTDINGCNVIRVYTITESPSLTASFTSTNPSGCVLANGTICATASGGSGAGYTYTWSPAGSGGANNSCNVNLGAGNFSVIIQDGAGCTTTLATTLSNPAGPTVNVTSASVTCFASNNGSAVAVASGSGPFTFTWSPATASIVTGATTTASGMSSGNYNISVSDNNGCITSQSLNISQPPATTITQNVASPLCASALNGSIGVVVSGGTPGYTYTWSPGNPTGQGTATVSGLGAGNYTVNITDANNCVNTRTYTVTQPASINVVATQTNAPCNGTCTAAISLSVTGGSPGYSFTWSPGNPTGQGSGTVTNLCAGNYTVNIMDVNNCPVSRSFTITQPTALNHTVNTTNLTCNLVCSGTASQVVTGGTPTYSFSWSSSAATTQSLGSMCAGNYTATVVDANGCQASTAFTLTQPTAISVTATPTHPLCNGSCNGSITTNVSGGNGGYNYSWLPTGTGPNPTGLCPQIYTLTVTDASLCIGNAVVTLTNPPAVSANLTFTNPSCNTGCNGVAISNPLNTTAPVSFTWSNASTTNSATALCAGVHSMVLVDAKGCTDTQTFTLTAPPALTVAPSVVPATCSFSNGGINVAPSGGTPAYTYTWFPPAVGNNSFVTNLPAGVYTVVVSDSQNCTNTLSIPLSNSNGPSSAAIISTSLNCFNVCNGTASVSTITGGTPGYTVSWLVPPASSSANPITNLCAGTYTAQITDANGCILFEDVAINQPTAIDDNETITNAICNGVCTGSINLAPSGGTGPFTYTWSTSATTSSVTNLCVGNHTVQILDALNCPFTATYTINGNINVTGAVASSSNLCAGNCLASSTVVAAGGGTPPYNYVWSNSQTGPVANNLCNGTYSVTITDNNGCKNTFTTPIISPAAITLTPGVSSPSCGLCNGSSSVNVSGGTAPYTYSWSSGGTGTVVSNLCAGVNQILVTDFNGCTQVQNVLISNSNGITGETFNVDDEDCFNQCDGSVTVTPIGGNPPISFSWVNPVSTNSTITNLCGGTYFVQMTDAQGCIRTSSVNVNSAVNMTITPNLTPPDCGATNGVIVANVTGGSGIYTYTWSPVAGSTPTLSNVGPGTYTLFVNDGACTQSAVVVINSFDAPVIFFNQLDVACSGSCTGVVAITPTLGTPGYTVNWSNGNTTNTVTNLCQGVITVTVTDAAGCIAAQSFTINEADPLNLSLPIITELNCNNDCNGSIALVPSGGTIPYVISWIPATTLTPSNPLTNLCAGSYTGIVTDNNGCAKTATFDLVNPPAYSITATILDATCNSSNDGAITTIVNGGTPAYTFTWSGPATSTAQSLSNVPSGTYTFSTVDSKGCVKDTVLTIAPSFTVLADAGKDTNFCLNNALLLNGNNSINALTYLWEALPSGTIANTSTTQVMPPTGTNTYVLLVTSSIAACFDYDTVVVSVNALPFVDAGPTLTISLFTSTVIGGSPTSGSAISYTWLPSSTLDNSNIPNPTASNTVNTTYTITVTDANGCTASDTVQVFIYPEIKIPNGFSPNSDGRNDTWIIDNLDQFPNNEVEVYNRWGELLLREAPYKNQFDGKYKGKDLPVGTYYYIIKLNHVAYPKPYTGPLTIFR